MSTRNTWMKGKYTAKSAANQLKYTTFSPEGWDLRVVTGKAADAIVSRIGFHCVVTTIMKPITVEATLSATIMHLREYMNVLWTTIINDAGEKPSV